MPQPPISQHIFEDLLESCYYHHHHSVEEDPHRSRWYVPSRMLHRLTTSCEPLGEIPQEVMESMPKRDRVVVEDGRGEKMETFWGLAAREKRCFFRVCVYGAACMTPSIAFAFAWLCSWGHAGDLQNASVPAVLSLGLLTVLWAAVVQ